MTLHVVEQPTKAERDSFREGQIEWRARSAMVDLIDLHGITKASLMMSDWFEQEREKAKQ